MGVGLLIPRELIPDSPAGPRQLDPRLRVAGMTHWMPLPPSPLHAAPRHPGPLHPGPRRPSPFRPPVRLAFALLVVIAVDVPRNCRRWLPTSSAGRRPTYRLGRGLDGQAERGEVQYTAVCGLPRYRPAGRQFAKNRVLPFFGVGPLWVSCWGESQRCRPTGPTPCPPKPIEIFWPFCVSPR